MLSKPFSLAIPLCMDGWDLPSNPQQNVVRDVGVVISNYLMARTRQICAWDAVTFQRARQWSTWVQKVRYNYF